MSDHARRLAKVESALTCGWARNAPLQVIMIRGGLPTDSGKPEAEVMDAVLVLEHGETEQEFRDRVVAAAHLARLRFVVIRGLPSRGKDWRGR